MFQRRNPKQIILAGVGIIVLVLLFAFVSSMHGGSAKAAPPVPETSVVVALQTIPNGTTFHTGEPLATYFGVRQVPSSVVPFGAYTSVKQLDSLLASTGCQPANAPGCNGQVTTTQTIYQNLPVVTGMFSTLGQYRTGPTPAFTIPFGYVAIGVGFTDVNSVVGTVQAGDDIDLIASFTGDENSRNRNSGPPTQTQYVLNDIRVLSVNGPAAAPSGSSSRPQSTSSGGELLLLVRYQQALIIQHLKDFGGSWTLSAVLRSAKEVDDPHFSTLPVNERWFFLKQSDHFDATSPY